MIGSIEEKAVKVVESCTIKEQIPAAQRYIELFFKRTKDLVYFKYLIVKLNEKIEELK